MKIIYKKNFPPKDFAAINILGVIIVRKDYGELTDAEVLHEKIHTRQMIELLIVFFYISYFLEWLVRLVQYRSLSSAYYNISYEREAYSCMHDPDYLNKRKSYSFIYYYKRRK